MNRLCQHTVTHKTYKHDSVAGPHFPKISPCYLHHRETDKIAFTAPFVLFAMEDYFDCL